MFQILVVEDDKELCNLYCSVLSRNGYHVTSAADGMAAFDIIEKNYIDLMITNVAMPKMDGYELTRSLRKANYKIPILMISSKGKLSDKREGFLAGIDDYMVKPIEVNEMLWRVEALLRRCHIISQRKLNLGTTEFNCDTLTVRTNAYEMELPQKEFFLLYKLVSSPNRIFTRRQIMDEIWGVENETDGHTLDVHISRLRNRFKNESNFEIVTVRGLGYKLVPKTE